MKIKTKELAGPALDWAVAKCGGAHPQISYPDKRLFGAIGDTFDYSTNWAQGGPVIEREKIQLLPSITKCEQPWHSSNPANDYVSHQYGPTPLIAAMRCFVASRLGEEVEVPEELLS